MTLENLLKPETYDFREEIISISPLDDVFTRYAAYVVAGLSSNDKKDDNVRFAAKKIAALYPEKRNRYGQDESESCILAHEVYQTLWDMAYLESCWKNPETKLLAADVMNSLNTTINRLIEHELGTDAKPKQIQKLRYIAKRKKVCFYYPQETEYERKRKTYAWSKGKSVLLFHCAPEWFKELLSPAEQFLSVAYTIGNFTPCPVGCNQPRGMGSSKDYWDLALACIYNYYEPDSDKKIKRIEKGKEIIYTVEWLIGKNYKEYETWLSLFGEWEKFVETNFMQPFVEGGGVQYSYETGPVPKREDHFGPPKELWKGHFSDEVLPKGDQIDQISDFFKNATKGIKARSERMVKELRKRFPNQQSE